MLSDAFDTDETEQDADGIVGGVLAEIGLDLAGNMADAPTSKLPEQEAAAPAEVEDPALAQLQAQLNAL